MGIFLTQKIAEERLNKRLIEENCKWNSEIKSEFLYNGAYSKLHLICNNCHNNLEPTYSCFVGLKTGCRKCAYNNQKNHNLLRLTQKITEERLNKKLFEKNYKWNNDFKFKYIGTKNTTLHLICNKCNNKFSPSYDNFISTKQSCLKCKSSKLEEQIKKLLEINNIEFIPQYSPSFIGQKSLDFYLPKYNIGIECQGNQHFKPFDFYGGELNFIDSINRDKLKFQQCKSNNLRIIYFTNENYQDCDEFYEQNHMYFNNIFTSEIKLLEQIIQ